MAITNPYEIIWYTSAFTAVFTVVCTIIMSQKKNMWIPLFKGAGLSMSIIIVLSLVWMVFL